MREVLHLALAVCVLAPSLAAQQSRAPSDTSPFRRLELPAPNSIRTGSGAPGRDYWQQRAD
ncbi:MAG TPA: hypothetical protein VFS33_02560, partial [Gemmatimonadales bacterium]|nr:hypothetical protein [Gemmatimonadales bacterium]